MFVTVQDGLRALFRHTASEIGSKVSLDGLAWDASGTISCGDGQRLRLLLTNGANRQVLRLLFFGNRLGLLQRFQAFTTRKVTVLRAIFEPVSFPFLGAQRVWFLGRALHLSKVLMKRGGK
jgi:hypothetical protein